MLRFPLIHPPLLAALAACGHGGQVLIADANYSHGTNAGPRATLGRLDFYATCREPDLAICVATGDDRLYANILLTVGFLTPSS